MPSNFDFLQPDWCDLHEDAVQTEANAHSAPRVCAFFARRTLERVVKWMYAHDSYLRLPYKDNLAALIHDQKFKDTLAPGLFPHMRMIWKLGNLAVHSEATITPQDSLHVTRCLHHITGWVVKSYSRPTPVVNAFDALLIPQPGAAVADKNVEQLATLQDKLADKDAAFEQSQQQLADTEEELARLKAEIQQIKAENRKSIADEDYTEAETRDLFIDLMLREAGWDPHGENVEEYEVTGMPTDSGIGYVDYVLWGDDALPLAIVEAKRTKVDARRGQRQAELYADCLEMTGRRPVIFYTNGYETWLWDDCNYPPRDVQGFYTKDELQLMVNRRESRKDVSAAKANRNIVDRYYHEQAIRHMMETFGTDKSRAALLEMATGSGKTRLSIAATEILMKHNWVRRVLFLADRKALLRQAKRAFNKHLPQASLANLVEEKENDKARIVFSTYPTMMNAIDERSKDGKLRFGVGHFDLIIIDEAHRSVYQKFGAIFDYFDAMLLGLTATPKDEIDKNTYGLFGLQDHVPTFAYELDQAVADEFLVPPKPVSVPLKFQRHGVKYADLPPEEQDEYEETFYDDEAGAWPAEIDASALNTWLFNKDTVNKVLKHLMERGQKVEGGDRIGKTIIFAKNQDHARFIVEQFDANYPHLAGKFCRQVDHSVNYAQSLIDDFYIANKPPHIAVSVDMLDTGIDVAEIVNLVFFKLVRSKTKFWQMVGRGTRLCPDLFGPGVDKKFFYIFDYCQNLEFFGASPDGFEAPLQESVKQKVFKRRLSIAEHLQRHEPQTVAEKKGMTELRGDLLDQMHNVVEWIDADNFVVRPHRRYVEEFRDRDRWKHLTTGDVLDVCEHLTPLPSRDDDEEFARRFDLLILNLQLSILDGDHWHEKYQRQVRTLADNLEEKRAIPAVAKEMELILDVQTDEYWDHVTLPMLEKVRRKLRNLIKFIDRQGGRENVYTDFEDELGQETEIEGLIKQDAQLKDYRLKVERFFRENERHETIKKLRMNEPISADDIDSLEALLFSEHGPGSREEFIASYGTEQPLGQLVRVVVGLDRNAAKEAFSEFLSRGSLTADQMTFINQIVDHLAENGIMDPSALFDAPFTDLHDEGVVGVMPRLAKDIVETIRRINANATAV